MNPNLRPKRYVIRLFVGAFVFFFVLKLGIRPLVAGRDLPLWLEIAVYSSPNTIEAIMGMCNGVGVLFVARAYLSPRFDGVPDGVLYLVATVVVTAYVVTQEMKLHDLGGRNLYDPYDVAASVVGVAATLAVFRAFGVVEREAEGAPAPE